MSSVTFGKRVVGEKAHTEAVAKAAGGADVFGKRVIGAITGSNPDSEAKRNSEFGVRTLGDVKPSGVDGKGSEISIDDLEALMDTATGNPTQFDSLYEAELARKGGPRKAALEIFMRTELGIKGAGRQHVIKEIRQLLGLEDEARARAAEDIELRQKQLAQQQERNEDNKKLADLPRLRSLRERDQALNELSKSGNKSVLDQATPLTTEGQRTQLASGKKGGRKGAAKSGSKRAGRKSPASARKSVRKTDSGTAE